MDQIPFNRADISEIDRSYISKSIENGHISGNGSFGKLAEKYFEESLLVRRSLLTTSCTHALEMCALLLNLKDGDEVIVPSFTFVSTASAFLMHGAKPVFVDINFNNCHNENISVIYKMFAGIPQIKIVEDAYINNENNIAFIPTTQLEDKSNGSQKD